MVRLAALEVTVLVAPSPSPSPSVPPGQVIPTSPVETALIVLTIALALAAGILGYRIIRGGRGL